MVQAIQALYENSNSVVLLNSQLWEFFKTIVDVREGCLLSPILFNLFLQKIIKKKLFLKGIQKLSEKKGVARNG